MLGFRPIASGPLASGPLADTGAPPPVVEEVLGGWSPVSLEDFVPPRKKKAPKKKAAKTKAAKAVLDDTEAHKLSESELPRKRRKRKVAPPQLPPEWLQYIKPPEQDQLPPLVPESAAPIDPFALPPELLAIVAEQRDIADVIAISALLHNIAMQEFARDAQDQKDIDDIVAILALAPA